MKNKFFLVFTLTLFSVMTASLILAEQWYEYSEPDISDLAIYINGEAVLYGSCVLNNGTSSWLCSTEQYILPALERGSSVDIKVSFVSNHDLEQVTLKAWITGYTQDIEEKTSKFDVFAHNTYTKTLTLKLPTNLEAKEDYSLYVQIEQKKRLTGLDRAIMDIVIQRVANVLDILSVDVYGLDARTFSSGSTIYANAVIKNRGNHEAEDVYAKLSIKELGIERTIYLGDIAPIDNYEDDEDAEDSKEANFVLPIPSNVREGIYTLELLVFNSALEVRKTYNINLVGIRDDGSSYSKPTGTVEVIPQTTMNEIEREKGAVYSLIISNFDSKPQNIVIEVVGLEGWATSTVTPSTFTLAPGQSKTVNLYIAVDDKAVLDDHIFSVKVKYGNEFKQVNLTAKVVGSSRRFNLTTLLAVIGIVLAVIIVILLIVLITTKKKTVAPENYY